MALSNQTVPVPGASDLWLLNTDPDAAPEAFRQRVVVQVEANATADEHNTVKEQLSGACITEIVAFDESAELLAHEEDAYDHIIFDTAPTGHTWRLWSLPKA